MKVSAEISRIIKAMEVSVEKLQTHPKWLTKSPGGKQTWLVSLEDEKYVCNCPDFTRRGKPCKHMIAVFLKLGLEVIPDEG